MSSARPRRRAEVRYYVDADTLGLAKVLAALRADVTYPGDPGAEVGRRVRPPCPVTSPDTLDRAWIPEVAGRGWAIITRDRHIRLRTAERRAVLEHGAKVFAIAGAGSLSTFGLLEIVMSQWRFIETAAGTERAPFIYSLHRTTATRVTLSDL